MTIDSLHQFLEYLCNCHLCCFASSLLPQKVRVLLGGVWVWFLRAIKHLE